MLQLTTCRPNNATKRLFVKSMLGADGSSCASASLAVKQRRRSKTTASTVPIWATCMVLPTCNFNVLALRPAGPTRPRQQKQAKPPAALACSSVTGNPIMEYRSAQNSIEYGGPVRALAFVIPAACRSARSSTPWFDNIVKNVSPALTPRYRISGSWLKSSTTVPLCFFSSFKWVTTSSKRRRSVGRHQARTESGLSSP